MPKTNQVQTNFTAGELSPKLWGRPDISRYNNGAKVLQNCWPTVQGGAQKRWGTLFVAAARYPAKRVILVPFVFSRTQAYMLEFGDFYMRVHTDAGTIESSPGVPYQIVTPYTEAMLATMDWTQAADTMLLWHTGVFPRRLRRLAEDNWVMDQAPFNPPPFDEIGHRPGATMTLSDGTVGAGRTMSASAPAFLNADVGREVWAGVGTALITGFTSSTLVTVTVREAFSDLVYVGGDWRITGTQQATLTPSAVGPVGAAITLTFPNSVTINVEPPRGVSTISHDGVSTATAFASGHGYSTGDTIQHSDFTPDAYNVTASITVLTVNAYTFDLSPPPGLASSIGEASRVTTASTSVDGWRVEDVGKHVRINDGLVRITGYNSLNQVTGIVLDELNTAVPAVANSWTLNADVWSQYDGYPATGTFHMQRLVAAGSPGYPQTVWGSGIGEYFGFQLGVNDDEAFSYTLVSDDLSPITYLTSMEALVALTYGAEFTMEGGIEKPITPTNIRAKQRSNWGCQQVRPVRLGQEEIFVTRGGKATRAISYTQDTTAWSTPDMSVLAEHLLRAGLVSLTWHANPSTLLMAAREDGTLITATYDRDQDVIGWARQDLGGVVESVATIPAGDTDRTWLLVRRVVGGQTVRYIEKFDPDTYTDSAIKGENPAGATVWTGLDHLEGQTVRPVADGVPQPEAVVTGGEVTLPRSAKVVEFGLPFVMRIDMLDPELSGSGGAAQGKSQRTSEISVRVLETVGLKVNDQVISFRELGTGILNRPLEPFTGLKRIENLGWERGASPLVIEHVDPLPCHVLSVIRTFTWNE